MSHLLCITLSTGIHLKLEVKVYITPLGQGESQRTWNSMQVLHKGARQWERTVISHRAVCISFEKKSIEVLLQQLLLLWAGVRADPVSTQPNVICHMETPLCLWRCLVVSLFSFVPFVLWFIIKVVEKGDLLLKIWYPLDTKCTQETTFLTVFH